MLLSAQNNKLKVTKEMEDLLAKSNIPGIGVAMVSVDSILYKQGFGFANLTLKQPYTSNTIQNIGSTSKTVIGVALMKLVDSGKIELDDAINNYLPFNVSNPYFPEELITIRHLATHTSGIKDRVTTYDLKSYYIDWDWQKTPINTKGLPLDKKVYLKKVAKNQKQSLANYLKSVLKKEGKLYSKKNFYNNKPGTIYEYSNIGAALAAYIIEIVAKISYADFTIQEIFSPLKMEATGWFYKDVEMNHFSKRYLGKNATPVPFYELITYPDGGLKSSLADMALYLQEMMRGYTGTGSLLSKASYKELFKNQLNTTITGKRSGIFWDIFGLEGEGEIGHTGVDPGIQTFMYFKPTTQIGKLLFINTEHYREQSIHIWEEFIEKEQLFYTSSKN